MSAKKLQVDPRELARVGRMLRSYLSLHEKSGISHYPASEGLRSFLRGPVPPVRGREAGKTGSGAGRSAPTESGPGLERIRERINDCTACGLAGGSRARFTGIGSAEAALLVVGDYPASGQGFIWGRDEDTMFWKMMAAIGLDRGQVYVSNCIRCPATETGFAGEEAGRICLGFVREELVAVQPRLVCTMGELAARLLLGSGEPLLRLRGRFQGCALDGMKRFQVMPTLHPRFLLRHPDMKRLAWMDLQSIQRRLASMKRKDFLETS